MSIKTNYKSATRPFLIQYNVIKALILREILTRWGRRNIGFLWLFAEQLLIMLCFWLAFYVRSIYNLSFTALGISLTAFVLIGHAPIMLYRGCVSTMSNAIKSNTALLHHRNLQPLDFYIARFILDSIANSASVLIIVILGIIFEFIPIPKDIPLLIVAWIMFIWFSFGFGLAMGILVSQYEWASIFWRIFSFILIFISGAYFYVRFLPENLRNLALLLPWVNGAEMVKHGYFVNNQNFSSLNSVPQISTFLQFK
jgi:capsular polysaccharide transport system permease protein